LKNTDSSTFGGHDSYDIEWYGQFRNILSADYHYARYYYISNEVMTVAIMLLICPFLPSSGIKCRRQREHERTRQENLVALKIKSTNELIEALAKNVP
jgi:hypothetical protein